MTIEEHEAYTAGLEDGEAEIAASKQLPNETDAEYKAYLEGYKEGREVAYQDRLNDPSSREFWED